jgi:hypothetical protein
VDWLAGLCLVFQISQQEATFKGIVREVLEEFLWVRERRRLLVFPGLAWPF